MIANSKPSILGLVLLCAFFIQFFLQLEWNWLFELQQMEMYKRWSGLVLALFIAFQWVLLLQELSKI